MNIYHGFCFGIDESKSDEISTPQSNQNEVFEKVDTKNDENFEDLVKVKIQLQQIPFVYSDVESLDDNMKREGPNEIDYSEVDMEALGKTLNTLDSSYNLVNTYSMHYVI